MAARGTKANSDARRPMSKPVWALGIAGLAGGLVSLAFSADLLVNLRWVWAAAAGLLLGGAAWVLAALAGSRKLLGILAVAACVAGIVAPIVVTNGALAIADRQLKAEASEAAGEPGTGTSSAGGAAPSVAPEDGVAAARPHAEAASVAGWSLSWGAVDLGKQGGGTRVVKAEVSARNQGQAAADPALSLGIDLVRRDGAVADSTACTAQVERPALDVGAVEPGESATFDVCFELPAAAAPDAALDGAALRGSDAERPEAAAVYWRLKD